MYLEGSSVANVMEEICSIGLIVDVHLKTIVTAIVSVVKPSHSQMCEKKQNIGFDVVLACTNKSEDNSSPMRYCSRTKVSLWWETNGERQTKFNRANGTAADRMRRNDVLLKCHCCWYCRINGNGVHWFHVLTQCTDFDRNSKRWACCGRRCCCCCYCCCCWNVIHSMSTHFSPIFFCLRKLSHILCTAQFGKRQGDRLILMWIHRIRQIPRRGKIKLNKRHTKPNQIRIIAICVMKSLKWCLQLVCTFNARQNMIRYWFGDKEFLIHSKCDPCDG